MRAALFGLVAGFGLFALSAAAGAAPIATPAEAASAAAIVQVRGGCGPGWHPQTWRGRYGHWHRRCVPNRRW
jgi:hypothetical protein